VVPYRIDSGPAAGHNGVVKVANEDYTPATVEQAITDQVDTTHAIGNLGAGVA
jgi:hypothetical protein